MTANALTITEMGTLGKGILEMGLTTVILAVGGNDIKVAN